MKSLLVRLSLCTAALAAMTLLAGCGDNLPEPAGPEMSVEEAMEQSMPEFKQMMSGDQPEDAAQMFMPGGGQMEYPGAQKK